MSKLTTDNLLGALIADMEISHGALRGGPTFTHDGTDYELVIDESFYADGDPSKHELRATLWTEDEESGSVEVATLRIVVERVGR